MVTAPCPVEVRSDDDSDFVRQALASHLKETGLPAGLPFHELPISDMSRVLLRAQALKTTSRVSPTRPRTDLPETEEPVRGFPFSRCA
jgi:hypothetical protein